MFYIYIQYNSLLLNFICHRVAICSCENTVICHLDLSLGIKCSSRNRECYKKKAHTQLPLPLPTGNHKAQGYIVQHKCISHSVISDNATPWTVALQAPLSMGFSRKRTLEWVAMPFSRGCLQPRA